MEDQSSQQPIRSTVPDPGDKDDFRSFSNPETPAESPTAAVDCEASATGGWKVEVGGASTMADGVLRSTA